MNLSEPSARFAQEVSNLPAQNFDYAGFNDETQIVVQQHTREIKSLLRRTAQDIFDIGQNCLKSKLNLGTDTSELGSRLSLIGAFGQQLNLCKWRINSNV